MQKYFAAAAIVLMVGTVLTRALLAGRRGIEVMEFGKLDKTDFLIPPFVLFYFYLIAANAFGLPSVNRQEFFRSPIVAWMGVLVCLAGLVLLVWALISFGQSFRVGIDTEHADKLVTGGVFAFSRNPIYVAFSLVMLSQFLVSPNWVFLIALGAGVCLYHRQVLREEAFLRQHYGQEYAGYCKQVRRYL